VERPPQRDGLPVPDLDGASFAPLLRDGALPSAHREQYSEFFGNRSFYADGHKLVTLHRPGDPYDDTEWHLYDIVTDPTETVDLADRRPELLRELAERWETAARENGVFPLDDGSSFVWLVRDPDEEHLARPVDLFPGTPTLERYRSQRLIAYRSFDVEVHLTQATTADGEPDAGVLVAHGDQGGGYLLFVEDGRVLAGYNAYGDVVELDGGPLHPGARHVRLRARVAPDLAWDLTLEVDGAVRAEQPGVPMLIGMAPFTGIDVGADRRGPVLWRLHRRHGSFGYSGTLHRVRYTPGEPAPYDPAALVLAAHRAFE
jgi:arylsulfatase